MKPLNLRREEAFDTVCFREGFDREDQYLMLHGIFYGNHSHEDGNTIAEFSANDRIFLVDASYTEGPTLKHHNGVTAVRNGEAWDVPALCRLEGAADLDRVGMSRTSVEGDWGATWVRNVVWRRGRCFLVLDEVEATQAGAFALQCHWRTLGTPALKDGTLEAVQRDPETGREDRFVLQSAGGGRMSLERDWENFGHWWDSYPYADNYVNILRESANREMAVGDRHTFINLFYASNPEKPVDDRMRRVGESAVVVDGSDGRIVAGTGGGDGAFEVGPLSGRAEIFAAGDGWFALCNGTSLYSEDAMFESERPVSIEFDLDAGEGVVVASEPAEISLCGERIRVAAGRQEVKTRKPGAGVFSMGGIADLPAYEADVQAPARAASVPGLRSVRTYDAGSGVRCAAGGAEGDGPGYGGRTGPGAGRKREAGLVLPGGRARAFGVSRGPGRAALCDCGRRRPASLSAGGRRGRAVVARIRDLQGNMGPIRPEFRGGVRNGGGPARRRPDGYPCGGLGPATPLF